MMAGTCTLNFSKLMREHKVTIRQLAKHMGVTHKAIRAVRAAKSVSYLTYCDYVQGATGENVFSLAHYTMLGTDR